MQYGSCWHMLIPRLTLNQTELPLLSRISVYQNFIDKVCLIGNTYISNQFNSLEFLWFFLILEILLCTYSTSTYSRLPAGRRCSPYTGLPRTAYSQSSGEVHLSVVQNNTGRPQLSGHLLTNSLHNPNLFHVVKFEARTSSFIQNP